MSSVSTPSTSGPSSARKVSAKAPAHRHLTTRQQDRQARNKDPFLTSDDSDSGADGGRYDAYGNDSYANVQARRNAAITLDSPELVMMLAQSRGDSIPATRHRLTKIMCGFITQADIDAEEEEAKMKPFAGSGNGLAGGNGNGSGSSSGSTNVLGSANKKKR